MLTLLTKRTLTRCLPTLQSQVPDRSMATLNAALEELTLAFPHKDAVRYAKQNNMKWTLKQLTGYTSALSSGLLDLLLPPHTTTILTSIPTRYAEYHCLQLACSRNGYKLVYLDSADEAVWAKALEVTGASAVFCLDATKETSFIELLRNVVPELPTYEDSAGEGFNCEKYPNLKYFIHTGFDLEKGFVNYKDILLFNQDIATPLLKKAAVSEDTVVFQDMDSSTGEFVGVGIKQKDIKGHKHWSVVGKVLNKEYCEA